MNLKQRLSPYYLKVYYNPNDKWHKYSLSQLEGCRDILDIGCGTGEFIKFAREKIIGIDSNKPSIKIAKERGFNVIEGNLLELPFGDNTFEGIHSAHVIEHLHHEEAYQMLKEIDRVLKPGGILCISTPLFHNKFYWNLTHVKPYYPQAIERYLSSKKTAQTTREKFGRYERVRIKYRHPQLLSISDSPLWFLTPICNLLHRFGISSWSRDAYTLTLRKRLK